MRVDTLSVTIQCALVCFKSDLKSFETEVINLFICGKNIPLQAIVSHQGRPVQIRKFLLNVEW